MEKLQAVWDWITAHQVVMASFVVAVCDFLMGITDKLKSNSVLELIVRVAQKLVTPAPKQ